MVWKEVSMFVCLGRSSIAFLSLTMIYDQYFIGKKELSISQTSLIWFISFIHFLSNDIQGFLELELDKTLITNFTTKTTLMLRKRCQTKSLWYRYCMRFFFCKNLWCFFQGQNPCFIKFIRNLKMMHSSELI